jgi:hypothetical protein
LALKPLLKRGALLAAANWPVVVIQFVAQMTFQVLLAVPIVGAAILIAVLLGADLANLLQGSMREIFTTIADALMSEPVALVAFVAAFTIVLLGGSVLMFLVKGGTVQVILAASDGVGPIESEPLTLATVQRAATFTVDRFIAGCAVLFPRYLVLGLVLMGVYGISAGAYLAFIVYGFRAANDHAFVLGWTFIAALSAVLLVLWITAVNLVYLLLQIATASGGLGFADALRAVARFVRAEFRELWGVFLVVFAMVVAAMLASALAWSGVGLIAFVPLVGLAVFPLQIAALLLRGLVFEYIGLTAMGAYVTLYQRPRCPRSRTVRVGRVPRHRRGSARGLGSHRAAVRPLSRLPPADRCAAGDPGDARDCRIARRSDRDDRVATGAGSLRACVCRSRRRDPRRVAHLYRRHYRLRQRRGRAGWRPAGSGGNRSGRSGSRVRTRAGGWPARAVRLRGAQLPESDRAAHVPPEAKGAARMG